MGGKKEQKKVNGVKTYPFYGVPSCNVQDAGYIELYSSSAVVSRKTTWCVLVLLVCQVVCIRILLLPHENSIGK